MRKIWGGEKVLGVKVARKRGRGWRMDGRKKGWKMEDLGVWEESLGGDVVWEEGVRARESECEALHPESLLDSWSRPR